MKANMIMTAKYFLDVNGERVFLSLTDKIVMLRLAVKAPVTITGEALSYGMGLNQTTVYASCAKLQKHGFIKADKESNRNGCTFHSPSTDFTFIDRDGKVIQHKSTPGLVFDKYSEYNMGLSE